MRRRQLWFGVLTAGFLLVASSIPQLVAGEPPPGKARKSPAARRLPTEVDLRPQLIEYGLGPRRQGERGTCSVFTTAASLEFALARQMGRGLPLSVEYLNWASNQAIHDNSDGGFFHDLLKGFEQYGICLEDEMPYQGQFNPTLAPSAKATATAAEVQGKTFVIHWINPWKPMPGVTDEQLREIKATLAAGWPVAAGSTHSRLLVGYVDDPDVPGGGSFLTKDSGSARFDSITYEFTKEKIGDLFWIESPAKKKAKRSKP